jgi:hypothetical protein
MNISSEFFSFDVWEWFLHSSVLEGTEFDLLKINWLCDVILIHSNSVGALGKVSIVIHSYQTYFGFLGSDLNLDYGLRDHVITRFTSIRVVFVSHSYQTWFTWLFGNWFLCVWESHIQEVHISHSFFRKSHDLRITIYCMPTKTSKIVS